MSFERWQVGDLLLDAPSYWGCVRSDKASQPTLRGQMTAHIGAPGDRFHAHIEGPAKVSLVGYCTGVDAAAVDAAVDAVRERVRPAGAGGLFVLTKYWQDDNGPHAASAHGVCLDGVRVERITRLWAKFSLDVVLPDPRLVGDWVSVDISSGTAITNIGEAETGYVNLEVTSGNNVQVTNDADPDTWLKVGVGAPVIVDCVTQTAVTPAGANVSGAISHSGQPGWFVLPKGGSSWSVSGGAVTLKYKPVWWV